MYKVGDMVQIRRDLELESGYLRITGLAINSTMVQFRGGSAKIISRSGVPPGRKYKLDIDKGCYTWDDEMFEAPIKHNASELYSLWEGC